MRPSPGATGAPASWTAAGRELLVPRPTDAALQALVQEQRSRDCPGWGFGIWAGTVGYRSVLAIYPEHQLSVAILTPSTTDAIPYVRHLVNAGGLRD